MGDTIVYIGPMIACKRDMNNLDHLDFNNTFEIDSKLKHNDSHGGGKNLACWPAGSGDSDCWYPYNSNCPCMKNYSYFISEFNQEDVVELPEFDKDTVEKWMEEEYEDLIKELKGVYGDKYVSVKVGIFTGWS